MLLGARLIDTTTLAVEYNQGSESSEAWVSDGVEDGVDCFFFHFSEKAGENFVFPVRRSNEVSLPL